MSSLPLEYKTFLYEISRALQLTITPIAFADFVVPTTHLHLRPENEDFSVSYTCRGICAHQYMDNRLSRLDNRLSRLTPKKCNNKSASQSKFLLMGRKT